MPKIPTGIESLDIATGGGLPEASFILLVGEAGGGKSEFTYTFAANYSVMKSDPTLLPEGVDVFLPEKFWYLTIGRSKAGILSDVQSKFSDEFYRRFVRGATFKEIFKLPTSPPVSLEWMQKLKEPEGMVGGTVLAPIFDFFEKESAQSVVVMYTLTDFAKFFRGRETDFFTFMESVREACREHNVLVVAILSSGILPQDLEHMMISLADGVLSFELVRGRGLGRGKNMLYVKKLRGAPVKIEPFEIEFAPTGIELIRVKTLAEI